MMNKEQYKIFSDYAYGRISLEEYGKLNGFTLEKSKK